MKLDVLGIRNGYLRLALESLRASVAPHKNSNSNDIEADWKDLLSKYGASIRFIGRTENLDSFVNPVPELQGWGKVRQVCTLVLFLAFLFFILASTVVGCTTIFSHLGSSL